LLNALRDRQNQPQIGAADFHGATSPEPPGFAARPSIETSRSIARPSPRTPGSAARPSPGTLRFAGLQRADRIVLDGRCVFADGPGGRRRVLAEEHHWRATQATRAGGRPQRTGGWRLLPESGEVVGPARLEVVYRQLRKALEDAKNEPGAADFYYGEMQMRRAATGRRTERWLLNLYWAISGYGLRARRALAWLTLVTILSITGMSWFGFPQTANDQNAAGTVATPAGRQPITLTIRRSDPVKPLADRVEKATEVTLNAVIFRNPDADLTTPGRYLTITVRILGPILLGLTILAIRNQVKR
jgi:hypothetical protein